MKKSLLFFTCILAALFIQAQTETDKSITTTQKVIIAERGKTWGKALRSKDISLLKDLYAAHAQYLPDDSQAYQGRKAILEYWESSLAYMGDLTLSMESLDGNEKLLYETGKGVAKIMNAGGAFEDFHFKYVNVWELQPDGSYQVVIDTFNGLGK